MCTVVGFCNKQLDLFGPVFDKKTAQNKPIIDCINVRRGIAFRILLVDFIVYVLNDPAAICKWINTILILSTPNHQPSQWSR